MPREERAGPPEGRSPRRAILAAVGAAVLWGTVGAAQELGAGTAAPASVAAVRSLGGGGLLAVVLAGAGRRRRLVHVVRTAPAAVAAAAACITVFQLGYLTGIRQVGVALGTLVAIGSAPAAAGALAVLAGRRPSRRWAFATVATVAGTGVLLLAGEDVGTGTGSAVFGVGAALVAGVAYGTYTTVSKRILDRGADPTAAMAVVFVGAGALLTPVLVTADTTWIGTASGMATAAWLAVATTVVGYSLFAHALVHLDAPTVTTLTLAEPLTATVLAIAVVGERPTLPGALGAALLLAGLLAVGGRPAPGGSRRTADAGH